MNKQFNELFILRPNKLFRFEVERIIFRDIQSEKIPMKYILHKEISQLLIGNISAFLYGVYKFCWLSQIWVVTLKHLFGQTIIIRHVYPTGLFKLSNPHSLKNTSFFISPKCCFISEENHLFFYYRFFFLLFPWH